MSQCRPPRIPKKWRPSSHDDIAKKPDFTFRHKMPRGAYRKLSPGQELAIKDCLEDTKTLRERLYQARYQTAHKYKLSKVGSTVYILCEDVVTDKPSPWTPPPTRSRPLEPVERRRTVAPNRTPWKRHPETGAYHCHDISPQARGRTHWELRRSDDPLWRWRVYRDGVAVAESWTLADARAEAEQLK